MEETIEIIVDEEGKNFEMRMPKNVEKTEIKKVILVSNGFVTQIKENHKELIIKSTRDLDSKDILKNDDPKWLNYFTKKLIDANVAFEIMPEWNMQIALLREQVLEKQNIEY